VATLWRGTGAAPYSSGSEGEGEEEGEDGGDRHASMLQSLAKLDRKQTRRRERSEAHEASEFNLRSSADTVDVNDLLASFGDSSAYGGLVREMPMLSMLCNEQEGCA